MNYYVACEKICIQSEYLLASFRLYENYPNQLRKLANLLPAADLKNGYKQGDSRNRQCAELITAARAVVVWRVMSLPAREVRARLRRLDRAQGKCNLGAWP
jgi:hypothetical protein